MADGNILIEVSTAAARDKLERLLAENRNLRRQAERCIMAWNVVRGGVWDPNGLMDEHVDALRKVLGPNAAGNRLARQGQSELTGLLGPWLRSVTVQPY